MINKGGKSNNLAAATSVLELARIEAGTAAKEVVDLAGFDIVGEARNEEGVDAVAIVVEPVLRCLVEVVWIVRLLVSHRCSLAGGCDFADGRL